MPNPPLDWRKIEAALEHCFRNGSYTLDRDSGTGDLVAETMYAWTLNLTELAKDLAAELKR